MFSGIRMIESALKLFGQIISKLEKGIEKCQKEVAEKKVEISDNERDIKEMGDSMEKARRVIENLKKLTL